MTKSNDQINNTEHQKATSKRESRRTKGRSKKTIEGCQYHHPWGERK